MIKEVKIPEISENVTTGTIVAVLVNAGDHVAADDVLVELETDKAVVEIPSPYGGRISEVLVHQGDQIKIGEALLRMDVDEDAAPSGAPKPVAPEAVSGAGSVPQTSAETRDANKGAVAQPEATEPPENGKDEEDRSAAVAEKSSPGIQPATEPQPKGAENDEAVAQDRPGQTPGEEDRTAYGSGSEVPAAPSVRRLARELGLDIRAVRGSGPDGRISPEDIHAHIRARLSDINVGDINVGDIQVGGRFPDKMPTAPPLPDFSRWGSVHTESVDTVHRLTAETTTLSWTTMPHVTQFDEADITEVEAFMKRHAAAAQKRGGRLTVTAVVMKACAAALERFPRFNASIDLENRRMIYKDYVHIGLAVATDRGLLVPVIRDVSGKGILDLAGEIADTAQRAREKKIRPDEFEGGTFTISNQGGIGGTAFTPVIVWPQAAILGISRARRALVEINGDFKPRTLLPLCVSYDHRVADGADAAAFLDRIARSLEQGWTLAL